MRVGPFALHRLDEAFCFPISARRVGRGKDVADAACGQQLLEDPGGPVVARVIGHHRLDRAHPEIGKVIERPIEKPRATLAALIGVDLDLGVAAVVIHGHVDHAIAHAVVVMSARDPTSGAVARSSEARELRGIEVDQRARARPLIAARSWPGL